MRAFAFFAAAILAIVMFVARAGAQPRDGALIPTDESDAGTPEAGAFDAGTATVAAAAPPEADAGSSRFTRDDGAPIGHAAAPTESGHLEVPAGEARLRLGLEVFAQYSYRNLPNAEGDATWFHAFDLPRAHGTLEAEWSHVRGRLVLEAVRSASEGALMGVAGDSLVMRIREGYAAYRPIEWLDVSAGVVPTLTVPNLDGTWMMRAVAPSGIEENGFLSPADLGARVRIAAPGGYGWLAAAAYNGEGYTSRELNRGKNAELAGEVHPFAGTAAAPLGVFGSYVSGSMGTTSARMNRATGGLVWQGAWVRVGAFVTYAWGLAQLGTQEGVLASAFARVEPVRRVLLGARVDRVVRDVDAEPSNAITTLWLALGYRLADPLETFFAFTRALPTDRARDEVPGSRFWDLRLIGRVVF